MKKKPSNPTGGLFLLSLLLLAAIPVSCGKGGKSPGGGRIVALSSDLGSRDAAVAQMKGSLLAITPSVRIVDLNHEVQTGNLSEASYLLDRSAAFFPAGTIFIASLEAGTGAAHKPILVQTREGKYYIGPDNGIFTHVMERELVEQAFELNKSGYFRAGDPSPGFLGRDVFGPVAAHLAAGKEPAELGTRLKEINRVKTQAAATLGNKTNGQVLHIDRYGNVITNIRQEHLPAQSKGRLLKISFKGRTLSLPFVSSHGEAPSERLFCLINSDGEFQIGLRQGSAAASQGFKAGDLLSVQN